jgi:hypothetical protein
MALLRLIRRCQFRACAYQFDQRQQGSGGQFNLFTELAAFCVRIEHPLRNF